MPSSDSQPPEEEKQWEDRLQQAEQTLINLRQRYDQIQRDRERKEEIEAQIQQLQSELESLEYELESNLVNWKDLQEPFWLAVRFGGLGIIIGWVLKSCAN